MPLAFLSFFLSIGHSACQDFSGWMVEPSHILSGAATQPATILSLGSDDPLGIAGHMGSQVSTGGGHMMDWSRFHSMLGGHTSLGSVRHAESQQRADWSAVLDPFMKDILDMMNVGLTQNLLPQNVTDRPCEKDIAKLCPEGDKFKSPLQCLGQNAVKVSDACKKDVKASLPYSCASEISAGCDGLEKSLIVCLSEKDKSKPLSKDCKNTLEITKTVIHKVNTAPITVLNLAPMNGTHVSATQITKEAHAPVWWECPAGFVSSDNSGQQQEMPCCSPTSEMKEPKEACAAGGGQWNLASQDGDGMSCCPHVGMIASESHSQHIRLPGQPVTEPASSHNWVLVVIVVAFLGALLSQALKLLNPKAAAALNSVVNRGVSTAQSNLRSKLGAAKKFEGPVGQGNAHPTEAEMVKRGTPPRKQMSQVYEETEFDL